MPDPTPPDVADWLNRAYDRFNARDIDAALAMMAPDVQWPNGMEGGYVQGQDEVREYWTRQWGMIDPHVEVESVAAEGDGRYAVNVRQTIRDLAGNMLNERAVVHVWRFRDGLVDHMEIRES